MLKRLVRRLFGGGLGERPSKADLGRRAEQEAARFLESKGMEILARNVRYRDGEVDIVAKDGEELVFVEVKARRLEEFGSGAEAVTGAKRARIGRAALRYLGALGREVPCRFDVVEVELDNRGRPCRFRHIRGAFEIEG